MNCPRKFLFVALVLGLSGAISVLPQSAPPAAQAPREQAPSLQSPGQQDQDQRARIRATVSLVVVPVSVKNGAGELVTDLQKDEFRIFEDAIEQRIAVFSVDAVPLSAAVLVDDDLKRTQADRVQKTLQALGGGFSLSDEVSLWRFDEVPLQVADFITDNDALVTQLKRIELYSQIAGAGSAPMTSAPRVNTAPLPGPLQPSIMPVGHNNNKHINDAIYAAAEQLRDRPSGHRKIIFLVSDGQNAKNNTYSYDETLKLLLSADISVYAVGVGDATLNRGINILSKYAHSTGGDIFYASSREDLERLYARVSEQARNQYTLAYIPAGTDFTQPYHAIEVRVRRPGLILLTRDGYYPGGKPQ